MKRGCGSFFVGICFLCWIGSIGILAEDLTNLGSDDAMKISRSGILAQKVALKVCAENVANATTLRTETGLPYQKKYAIFHASEAGVKVSAIRRSTLPFKRAYDPGNPLADQSGFISLPNVNLAEEMTQISMTNVLYEANTTAYKSAKTMYQQSMEILK